MSKEPKQPEPWQLEDAARLKAIFEAKCTVSQTQFGADHGIGTQGMVWQYLAGRRPLNIEAAVAFARGLGVGIVDFSPAIASRIKDAASVIETHGAATSSPAAAANSGPQWIRPEAYQVLDLYFSLNDEERRDAMRMMSGYAASRRSVATGNS